jgi:hypothetical protein
MEHLGRPVPIVAIAAVLATAACSTTQTAPQATAQAQPAGATSATVQAAQPAPSSPSSVEAGASSAVSGDILDEIALTRAAIQTRRQAIVTAAMDLTAPESQAFWPLYRDYRTDMAKVDDRLVNLIIVYAGNYDSLSDDMATKLLNDYLDIERARLEVKTQYVPRFLGVIPATKVARFYQVDNKLDKKIQAELAAEIPLTR